MSLKDKNRYIKIAEEEARSALLNIDQLDVSDAGRLAIGIPAILLGSLQLLITPIQLAILCQNSSSNDVISPLLLLVPWIFGASVISYVGLDNIIKVVTHYDRRKKYDKALAVESMIIRKKVAEAQVTS